jgi:hypothetical protein
MHKEILTPNLDQARDLLESGFDLVKLKNLTKQPDGVGWQLSPVTEIDDSATGYGVLLARNSLCSVDPDIADMAAVGVKAWGFRP